MDEARFVFISNWQLAVTIKLVKTLQMFKVAFKKMINRGKSLQLNKTKEIAIKDNDKGKQIISYRLWRSVFKLL